MTALSMLKESGVMVERNGDKLRIRTLTGQPLSPEAIELARTHKIELLAALPDTSSATVLRARLLRIAEAHAIPAGIVHAIATNVALEFCMDMTDAELCRWLNIVGTRALHARGLLPSGVWAIPSAAHVQGGPA